MAGAGLKRIFGIVACLAILATAGAAAPPSVGQEERSRPVAPVDPEIPVALLVDLSTGQTLFAREPDRRFMPASVTKVMTAYTAFDLVQRGELPLDREIEIDQQLEDEWGGEGSTLFLEAGDRVTIGQLLLGITTVSANDASIALARTAAGSVEGWLELMNENAVKLGMRDSHFGTPNGWPDEGRTYTSARDLARLAEALTTRFPSLYKRYFGHRGLIYNGIAQDNHDPLTGVVDGADGIKTGYTRQAGFTFLGSAERDGRRLAVVIAAAPTGNMRNQAARRLVEWGFSNFASQRLLPANTYVGEAMVQDGSQTTIALHTEADVFANLPRVSRNGAELSLRYRGPIEAPIKAGDRVATLRVAIAGQEPHDVPLVAAEDIGKANAWQRLRNGLAGLVR
jgi:D-alanyl-D-alanine carboxypeptidase (penicillin-binding protein 5/6)